MWQIRWQIYPPKWQFSIPIYRFLLPELTCGRSYGRSTPRNGNFTFLLIDSYFESSDVADHMADLPPRNGNFRFLLIDSYLGAQMWQIYPPGKW